MSARRVELGSGGASPELTGACYCIASADDDITDSEIKSIAESIAVFSSNAVDATEQLIARARNEVMSMFADRKVAETERATFFAIASAIGVDATQADFILRSIEAPLR